MSELYLMATISDRNQSRRFLAFYKEYGISVTFLTLGRGTAASEVLDAFGLEASEKAVQFAVVTASEWKKVKKGLEQEIKIDIPGTGIAFVTPLSSIGGKRQLRFLTEDRGFEKEEESSLKGTDYELLVVIANQGYTDDHGCGAKGQRYRRNRDPCEGNGNGEGGKVFRRFPCSGERDDLYGHEDKG